MGNTKTKPCEVENKADWIEEEEIRLAHNKKLIYSQIPSIWQYNPKGGVPKELVDLDSTTFLTRREGQILCSLPRDVLIRICSMLSAWDFVDLSLTCRFLHWRMFTFCTCYASYTATMEINDDILTDFWKRRLVKPKSIYILNNGGLYELGDPNGFRYSFNNDPDQAGGALEYPRKLDGQRGLFVYQSFSLRKPFLFNTLELKLNLPFYCEELYSRCLPFIMAVRGFARDLDVTFVNHYPFPEAPFLDFWDTNYFLETINASYYNIERLDTDGEDEDDLINLDIYLNCPYARQMKRASIYDYNRHDIINVPVFENSIGIYGVSRDDTKIATLDNFLTGSTSLIYHQYYHIYEHNGAFPLIEYLFQKFGEFEELFCVEIDDSDDYHFHIWKKVVATENGGRLRIVIKKWKNYSASLRIGKDEMFDEIDTKYTARPLSSKESIWWKMETAVEPDEAEESGKTNEIEVEQEVSLVCLSLDYKCSIQ